MCKRDKPFEKFDWAKFKPPICAYAEIDGDTVPKVLDGQRIAIAAANNLFVSEIPVMIVEAEDTMSQARAFIGQNADRVGLTSLQLHHAAVAAGEGDAKRSEEVCAAAGVKILKRPGAYNREASRETIAVAAIKRLISRRGDKLAREILEIIANAERGPITAQHIKAVEFLMAHSEHSELIIPEDLTAAVLNS
jgi:hypothetical protein